MDIDKTEYAIGTDLMALDSDMTSTTMDQDDVLDLEDREQVARLETFTRSWMNRRRSANELSTYEPPILNTFHVQQSSDLDLITDFALPPPSYMPRQTFTEALTPTATAKSETKSFWTSDIEQNSINTSQNSQKLKPDVSSAEVQELIDDQFLSDQEVKNQQLQLLEVNVDKINYDQALSSMFSEMGLSDRVLRKLSHGMKLRSSKVLVSKSKVQNSKVSNSKGKKSKVDKLKAKSTITGEVELEYARAKKTERVRERRARRASRKGIKREMGDLADALAGTRLGSDERESRMGIGWKGEDGGLLVVYGEGGVREEGIDFEL